MPARRRTARTPRPAFPDRSPRLPRDSTSPLRTCRLAPPTAPRVRVVRRRSDTAAMLASASPRKAERADARDVAGDRDLRGRVALDGELEVVLRNAGPSSTTAMRTRPPPSMATSIRRRAGVECVLDELLEHRGRSFDHLARRDGVGDHLRQPANRAAAITVDALSCSSASLLSAAIGVMPSRSSEASSVTTGFGAGSL